MKPARDSGEKQISLSARQLPSKAVGRDLNKERRMKTREARDLGKRIAAHVQTGQSPLAYDLLAPVLAERTPFRLLNLTGEAVGAGPLEMVNPFLEHIAVARTEGGWVVIASVLREQLKRKTGIAALELRMEERDGIEPG